MIQVCYFCNQVYGEKEPLQDKQETHGECDLCHLFFIAWYVQWKTGSVTETATQFILKCREILGESHKESVVESCL
jgi:hypothetical protein